MKKNVVLIANPVSGGMDKAEFITATAQYAAKEGFNYFLYETTGKGDDKKIKEIYNTLKPERIIIAGGDGTIKLVVEAIGKVDVIFGILPAGSANEERISCMGAALLKDAASDGVEFCKQRGVAFVGGGHDGVGQGCITARCAKLTALRHGLCKRNHKIAGFGPVALQRFDHVAHINGTVVWVPAVIIGDHGDGGITKLGFTGEFCLWHIRHANHVAAPRAVHMAFGLG